MHSVSGLLIFLLNNFDLLSVVFRIGLGKAVIVGGWAEPVISCFELIRPILELLASSRSIDIGTWVCTFASEGKLSSSVSICRFDVLILSSMSGVLCRIWGDFLSRSSHRKGITWPIFFNGISLPFCELIVIGGFHVQMWPFQFLVFFGHNNEAFVNFLRLIRHIVDGRFGEVRFDGVHFTQMSATVAFLAQT